MTTEERLNKLEKQVLSLEKQSGKLNFPLDFNSQKIIEMAKFQLIQALVFKGGLPIFTSARTDVPTQGEVYLTDIGGTRKINAYINKVNYSATLT